MKELWSLLLSAQENIGGIPSTFLEKKKEEIKQRKVCIGRMFWFRISQTSLMYHSNKAQKNIASYLAGMMKKNKR